MHSCNPEINNAFSYITNHFNSFKNDGISLSSLCMSYFLNCSKLHIWFQTQWFISIFFFQSNTLKCKCWACIRLLGVALNHPLPVWSIGCNWCTPSRDYPAACCSWCRAKELAWCWPASVCARPADEPSEGPVCTEEAEEKQSIGSKRIVLEKAEKSSNCLQNGQRANGWYLVIEHEQKGAFHIHIAGPFDLETVGLLSGGHSVPLKENIK